MTKDEFIEGYLKRSGEGWLQYRNPDGFQVPGTPPGRVALPCYCGDDSCDGWAMIPDRPEDIEWHMSRDGSPPTPICGKPMADFPLIKMDESDANFLYEDTDSCWQLYVDGEIAAGVSCGGEATFDWPAIERAAQDRSDRPAWAMTMLLLAARDAGRS